MKLFILAIYHVAFAEVKKNNYFPPSFSGASAELLDFTFKRSQNYPVTRELTHRIVRTRAEQQPALVKKKERSEPLKQACFCKRKRFSLPDNDVIEHVDIDHRQYGFSCPHSNMSQMKHHSIMLSDFNIHKFSFL